MENREDMHLLNSKNQDISKVKTYQQKAQLSHANHFVKKKKWFD